MRSLIKISSVFVCSLVLCISCIGFSNNSEDEVDNDAGTEETSGMEESNANLSALSISVGALSFDPDITTYTVEVGNTVASLTCTATVANEQASLKIDDEPAVSGEPFGPIDLVVGQNTIMILVTAPAETMTYTVIVTRLDEISHNADLSGLTISQGTLTPAFLPAALNYTSQVANDIETLTVTPTAAGTNATITVNGVAVDSENPAQSVDLIVGDNTITVMVTAEDGFTTKTYTIVVTMLASPSTNADLSNLTISKGVLTPAFQSDTLVYTAQVANAVKSLTVTPTAAGVGASITVNGVAVVSGSKSRALKLNVGPNTITIIVTAQTGAPTKTYTIVVTRAQNIFWPFLFLAIDN